MVERVVTAFSTRVWVMGLLVVVAVAIVANVWLIMERISVFNGCLWYRLSV